MQVSMPTRLLQSSPPQALPNNASIAPRSGQLDSAPPMPAPTILLIGRTLERAARSVTNSVPLTWESLLDGVEVSIAEKNANQSLERSFT